MFLTIKSFFYVFLNSFKVRLILSVLAMVIIILPTIAFIIMNSFEKHMVRSIENELSAYSYSILAVAEIEAARLVMPEALIENQFNVSDSGLYAFISRSANHESNQNNNDKQAANQAALLWRSQSSLTLNLLDHFPEYLLENIPRSMQDKATHFTTLATGDKHFSSVQLNDIPHFIYSYAVSFTDQDNNFPLTVHIVSDKQTFSQLMTDFKQQLWLGLTLLMVIILLLQLAWLMWTLKPLSTLQQEVKAVEQGRAEKLTSLYPKELAKLTAQLNQLLATEQKQRQRYRNSLSDLAHSLKTPLAVLQAQSDISEVNQEQINRINSTIDHQLKRAQSAGKSSWLLGISVKPVIEKLLSTLAKIYQDKNKSLTLNTDDKITFKGDEADLLELLGNVLDNAYKAAKSTIRLTISQQKGVLIFCIEDDGIGIKRQKIAQILERGVRADTYEAGHGVGLAIVRDLIESYQGELHIGNSEALGGASFTLRFKS